MSANDKPFLHEERKERTLELKVFSFGVPHTHTPVLIAGRVSAVASVPAEEDDAAQKVAAHLNEALRRNGEAFIASLGAEMDEGEHIVAGLVDVSAHIALQHNREKEADEVAGEAHAVVALLKPNDLDGDEGKHSRPLHIAQMADGTQVVALSPEQLRLLQNGSKTDKKPAAPASKNEAGYGQYL